MTPARSSLKSEWTFIAARKRNYLMAERRSAEPGAASGGAGEGRAANDNEQREIDRLTSELNALKKAVNGR